MSSPPFSFSFVRIRAVSIPVVSFVLSSVFSQPPLSSSSFLSSCSSSSLNYASCSSWLSFPNVSFSRSSASSPSSSQVSL